MTPTQVSTTLQEADVLRARIESLLHEKTLISGRSRRLILANGGSGQGALLLAVRETQRPCKLVFRNERKEVLAFEIASGRILRLSTSTSQTVLARVGGGCTEANATFAKGDASYLGRLIHAFSNLASELTVERLPPEENTPAIELGVDVDKIPVEDKTQLQSPSEDTFISFLQACESFSSSALLLCDDKTVLHYGSEVEHVALLKIAQSERDAVTSPERATDKVSCVIFSGHPTDGSALLCQASGNYLSLLCFKSPALQKLLIQWEASFGVVSQIPA